VPLSPRMQDQPRLSDAPAHGNALVRRGRCWSMIDVTERAALTGGRWAARPAVTGSRSPPTLVTKPSKTVIYVSVLGVSIRWARNAPTDSRSGACGFKNRRFAACDHAAV
jgi:hypothetical protein